MDGKKTFSRGYFSREVEATTAAGAGACVKIEKTSCGEVIYTFRRKIEMSQRVYFSRVVETARARWSCFL